MKLDKSHIGKEVKLPGWINYVKVWAVSPDGSMVWCSDHSHYLTGGDWIIREEEKKPSERIKELMGDKKEMLFHTPNSFWILLQYLDEEFEKRKK